MASATKSSSTKNSRALTDTGDAYLLTPGPLTTSKSVKQAMLHDYGSREQSFINLNRQVCEQLLALANAGDSHECIPLQGSGTFAIEAMLATLVPPTGKVLNLVNGAYGHRVSEICRYIGRDCVVQETAEDMPVDPAQLDLKLKADKDISHVSIIYCETTAGILNPLADVAEIVKRHGRALLIDAMSAFGGLALKAKDIAFDGLAASSNKCLQGVPGIGFCLINKNALERSEGNAHSLSLDLYQQSKSMKKNGQYRFTPPVHCLLALAQALKELAEEGGVPAREQRYRENCRILREGMLALGFKTLLPDELQAPIIVTFHSPTHPAFNFKQFYDCLSEKGYIIYPGKITNADTFRVGCIGDIGADEMRGALDAIKSTLEEMKVNLQVENEK